MRRLFTLILGVFIASSLFAQRPEAVVMKASTPVVIDGVIDDVWAETDSNVVDKNFKTEVATVGEAGTTYWKALWDDAGMYVLVVVNDDEWRPAYGASSEWLYDKAEVYFDVNYLLEDKVGGGGGKGHYQVANPPVEAKIDGTPTTETNGVIWAYKVENPTYLAEYFIPWSLLMDLEGLPFDKTGTMGFDVTVIDKDAADATDIRRRSVWANVGAVDESYANMDDCGKLTFDKAGELVEVESVAITGGAITADNGTLQIAAEVLPVDASIKALKWKITSKDGAGRATISSTGLVTAITNGVVVVNASSTDGTFKDAAPVEVTISGQVSTIAELSYLKNGYFDNTTTAGAPVDWTVPANGVVVDGVLEFGPPDTIMTNQYDYTLLQRTYVPLELKDEEFILSFKAWADEERTLPLVLEDAYNDGTQWDAYATSTDAGWNDKTWTVNLTTEPTIYTLHLNFSLMKETTQQNFNFQVGKSTAKIHLDSIYLVSVADMALVPAIEQKLASFKIYPNPADTKLHISLNTENTVVAIYNSVGVKMEEVVVPGTQHTFDVSRYTRGLYFVKANNSVMKFVK